MAKRKKIDLDALGYNENFACPKCKKIISLYFFIDKFTTPIGTIKNILEEDYDADSNFMEYILDGNLTEELDNETNKIIKKKLKEYYKDYKKGKKRIYKGTSEL